MSQLQKISQSLYKKLGEQKKYNNITKFSKQSPFPRINRQFIGLSHKLQQKRTERRKIAQEQLTLENRVHLLQMQEAKAKKQIKEKKKKLLSLMQIKQRQQHQQSFKNAWKQTKEEELQRLKNHNEYMRLLHKDNMKNAIQDLSGKNHYYYTQAKQQLKAGEAKKKQEKWDQLATKKDKYIDINISKEYGKIKIDQFYKKKNQQHIQQYYDRMKDQEKKAYEKRISMRKLQSKQQLLRSRLEHSTLRASRMEQMLEKISKTLDAGSTSRLRSFSQNTRYKNDGNQSTNGKSFSGHNGLISNLLLNDESLMEVAARQLPKGDQVQQKIEYSGDQLIQKEINKVRKRRKNKHVNRYKQYEAF